MERLLERGKTSGRADDNEETIRTRIKVFNDNTRPALEFYSRFGKVHSISSIGSIEDVYSQVLLNLKKTLVFFYGAPSIGKTEFAKIMCETTGFAHLELREFWKGNKQSSEEEKVNRLMNYLSQSGEESFLIDGFFESKKQAKIFMDTFQKPMHVFYFEATKDYVDERLLEENSKEKEKIYKEFMKSRKELVDFMKKEPYFVHFSVTAEKPIESLYHRVINEYLAPEVFMAIYDDNEPLFRWYVQVLEKERGFIHLPLNELLKQEAERRTVLGLEISNHKPEKVPSQLKLALLRKILFKQGKKFKYLITEFPNDIEEYFQFEGSCREISSLISFEQPNQGISFVCGQEPVLTPQTYYHTIGKHMVIDGESLALFDYYTQKRNTYHIALAPPYFERTIISKHLSEKFGLQLVEWEDTITKLKEKLGGEDGPLEDVTVPQILKHFQEVLKNLQVKGTGLIFDGFPYGVPEIQAFVEALGAPTSVLDFELTKEEIIRAYRLNKGIEPDAEIGEEDIEEMNKGLEKHQILCENFEKVAEETVGVNFYKINSNISMSSIKNFVEKLFYKRVYLVSHSFPIYSEGGLDDHFMHVFANVSAKYQVSFIDVRSLIRKEFNEEGELFQKLNSQLLMRWTDKPHDFPSNYTPELIVELIKRELARLPVQTREILIYNYPMADNTHDRNEEERMYPRALDEIVQIESNIGQIRMVFSLNERYIFIFLF